MRGRIIAALYACLLTSGIQALDIIPLDHFIAEPVGDEWRNVNLKL